MRPGPFLSLHGRRLAALLAPLALLLMTLAHAQPLAAYVPATGQTVRVVGLVPGATYQLRISGWMTFGTWRQNGRTLQNDACYEFAAKGYADPLPVLNSDLGTIQCGPYESSHVYTSAPFTAPSSTLSFWVFDSDYRDNSGSLLVELLPASGPGASAGRYCVLRNQDLYGPPVCYQFYLADTTRSSGAMAVLSGGGCAVTELAARQGWEVDPSLGGPYATWEGGDQAMSTLSRYGGDLYGCLAAQDAWDPWEDEAGGDPWANSCPWANDGECDEPGIGTGLCDAGTDTNDCSGRTADPANSCMWAYDGECDEPGIGTGVCDAGTDTADCRGIARPDENLPDDDLPEDVEERDQELNQCEVWSASNSGGAEGTVDRWDVSTIPDGAVFDLRYDAESMPDAFRVDYRGARVWNSGWRGSSSYVGNPAYPGGIAGDGAGERLDLFQKAGADVVTVTVIGGESGTVWSYQIRCRMP